MATTHAAAGFVTRHHGKPWIEKFARVGFAAKALLYLTVGLLAASAALGKGNGKLTDSKGAMTKLFEAPYGRALLGVIALGLLGYALWRIIAAITDAEDKGSDAKGIAKRAGSFGRGVLHLALAGSAASLAVYEHQRSGGGQKHWLAKALEWPGGKYIVGAVALGLIAYGVWQLYRAAKAKLDKQLDLGRVSHGMRRAIVAISRFGIAARAIVIGTIGMLVGRAALNHSAREGTGLADSLRELLALGTAPFLAIAFGLAAYGVYQLVEARYRRISVN